MRRILATMTAAAAAMAGIAGATPVPVAPAAQSIPLGADTLTALRDAVNAVPNDGKVFGKDVGPQAVAGALAAAGMPTGVVTLDVDALLVRMPGRLVLIDTGLGPKVGGALMGSLNQAGVAPAKVTDVLLTHGHGDHVGGLLTAAGASAFPNAAIRLSAAEWASIQAQPAQAALVEAIRGQVRPFDPGRELLPGITPVALTGHTPGHVGYEIVSNGKRLLDIGDSAHSSLVSLAHPEWVIGYDGDADAGRANRRALLKRLAASHEILFAPHFPFPGFGRIAAKGQGYQWVPLH
jgi:glyoxylase-like metal-dependent hydrolase (beta-lactamase superfamily II)